MRGSFIDPRSSRWLARVVGGAIAFPIAVLVHELAHFTAFATFGFPDPQCQPRIPVKYALLVA